MYHAMINKLCNCRSGCWNNLWSQDENKFNLQITLNLLTSAMNLWSANQFCDRRIHNRVTTPQAYNLPQLCDEFVDRESIMWCRRSHLLHWEATHMQLLDINFTLYYLNTTYTLHKFTESTHHNHQFINFNCNEYLMCIIKNHYNQNTTQ